VDALNRPARPTPGSHQRNRFRRIRLDETGAEAVEFALVAPLVFILIFGLIYVLLGMAAQLSLTHAASVGIRFATIPSNPAVDLYPDSPTVKNKVMDSTPFFTPEDCTTAIADESGTPRPNLKVTLTVSCDFPNPAGAALSGLTTVLGGDASYDSDLTLTADARGRRE
jgi:Flp pilus assembly protein TadG